VKIVFSFFLFITVAFSSASGQAVFTLDRCLTLARTQNPRMRNAENAIRTAELSHAELSQQNFRK